MICCVSWCSLLCLSSCCNFGWLINMILSNFLWLVFRFVSKCSCFSILGSKCCVLLIISMVFLFVVWLVVNLFRILLVKYFRLVCLCLYLIFSLLYIVVSSLMVDSVGFRIIVIWVELGNCCSSFFDIVVLFVFIFLVSIINLLFFCKLKVRWVSVFLWCGFM